MNPIQFCVKFNPPTLCLIYEFNREEFFHEFLLTPSDLEMPTKHLVKSLKEINSVYLSNIDSEQIAGLIERIKKELKRKPEPPKPSSKPENSKKNESSVKPSSKPAEKTGNQPGGKVSSVDKFRKMLGNLGISDSDESSSDEVDFCAVEKSFQNGSDTD